MNESNERILNEIPNEIEKPKKVEVVKKVKKYSGVTTHKVNVRSRPNLNSKIVRIAKRGENLGQVELIGEWVKIEDGFIKADFVELADLIKL